MFGWLQVGMTKNAKEFSAKERAWAEYHPHFHPQRLNSSVIYLATENLQVRGVRTGMPGYRVFPLYREALRLTAQAEVEAPGVCRNGFTQATDALHCHTTAT